MTLPFCGSQCLLQGQLSFKMVLCPDKPRTYSGHLLSPACQLGDTVLCAGLVVPCDCRGTNMGLTAVAVWKNTSKLCHGSSYSFLLFPLAIPVYICVATRAGRFSKVFSYPCSKPFLLQTIFVNLTSYTFGGPL